MKARTKQLMAQISAFLQVPRSFSLKALFPIVVILSSVGVCDCNSTCSPPTDFSLKDRIEFVQQEYTMWCWAACMYMVLHNWEFEIDQCKLADDRLDRSEAPNENCCRDEISLTANAYCFEPRAPHFELYGFTNEISAGFLKYEAARFELGCRERPFIRGQPGEAWGHTILAYAYDDATRQIACHDPLADTNTVGNAGAAVWINNDDMRDLYLLQGEDGEGAKDYYHIRPTNHIDTVAAASPAKEADADVSGTGSISSITVPLDAPKQEIARAANRATTVFLHLAARGEWKALGFRSQQEVKSAKLGEPIKVFYVGSSTLTKYLNEPFAITPALFATPTKRFFPVEVDGQVRSSVTFLRKDQQQVWSAAMYGEATLARQVAAARLTGTNHVDRSSLFLIEVPRVGRSPYFLAFWTKKQSPQLKVIPLAKEAYAGQSFDPREPMPAEQVFTAIAKVIRAVPRPRTRTKKGIETL